ncbi:MFS transporter [Clostridium intestinale]|uniref:MFS transporter n=1 Tax=Clostridium intestinale TaxID=36845 RepID=UPI002DD67681|nr:MFS transporter [Clostridium intestinale]WRY50493.1 MFS transporter [Clostridium intestinale]
MKNNKLIKIYIVNRVFHWLIMGLTIPVITMILLDKGLDFLEVGLLISIQSAMVIIMELPSGAMSDAIGRKRVYMIAMTASLICGFLFMFVSGFALLALVAAINGVVQALSSGTIDAWFVDEFKEKYPDENLQKALSIVQIFTFIFLALSSIVGGILPMTLGSIVNTKWGLSIYAGNFIVQILLLLIHILLTIVLIKENEYENRKQDILKSFKTFPIILKNSVKEGVKNKYIFLLLLTAVAWGIGFSGLEAFWQPKVKTIVGLESGDLILGVLSSGYFLAGALGSYASSHICKLVDNNLAKLLIILRSILGILFIILAFQNNIIGFAIGYLVLYSVNGMSESPYYTLFNNEVKSDNRATLLSLESLFMKFGGMVGSIGIGYISRQYSISIGWTLSGVVLFISSLAFLKLYKLEKEKVNNNILG